MVRVTLPFPALLIAALLAALIVGTWIALGSTGSLASGVTLTLYALANLVLLVDGLDLILRIWFRWRHTRAAGGPCPTSVHLDVGTFTPYQVRQHLRPYALLVSVHNMTEELAGFLEAMEPYRDHLWVIDDASTDDTWLQLQQAGLHAVRGSTNRKKPGAIKALLVHLPPEIVTVVVLDPDVRMLDGDGRQLSNLDRVIFEFQCSRMAAVTPRIVVRPDGWLARLQAFEYAMACALGRKSLADRSITSGIAIYRRDALVKVLDTHTLSVYAEDLQNALILLGQDEAIYYDERLVIETEGKRTWPTWFSQRVGWSFGLLKVYAEHLGDVRRSAKGRLSSLYQFVIYLGLFAVPLHPFRLLALGVLGLSAANGLDFLLGLNWIPDVPVTAPALFLSAYFNYTLLGLVASLAVTTRPREWLRFLPAVPVYFFYVHAQILPATVGYANWLSLRVGGGRLYRDHYDVEESLRRRPPSRAAPGPVRRRSR